MPPPQPAQPPQPSAQPVQHPQYAQQQYPAQQYPQQQYPPQQQPYVQHGQPYAQQMQYVPQQYGAPGVAPDPLATALLSPWGHTAALVLALIGILLNVVGGAGFPGNAPVEWIMNAGITIDLVAVALACGIGLLTALKRRPARPSFVFPWLGLGFSVLALLAWASSSGGLWETLFLDGRGRYMNDIGGAFVFGIPWTLGAIFSAYSVRGNTKMYLNVAAYVGIALWAITLAGVIASALLYGARLTD